MKRDLPGETASQQPLPWLRLPQLTALGVAMLAVGCAPPRPATPEAAMTAFREQINLTPTTAVSFLRNGRAEGIRLILVHGTPGSATAWADYVANPPAGAEVVALDRPGFGESSPQAAVTTLKEQAAAVIALLPTDGRRAVLLGHSLGGPVVARVAADQPQRVAAVVLLAASMDPGLERIHPAQHMGAWPLVRNLLPRVLRNANAELMALKPELQALAQDLPRITAKVVIMHGTQDDLVPVSNVDYVQPRLTGAACVKTLLLQGKNHFLPWNSQADVRRAIDIALEPQC